MNTFTLSSMIGFWRKTFIVLIAFATWTGVPNESNAHNVPGILKENAEKIDISQWVICPPSWINVSCSQLDPGLNYGNPTIAYGCGCGAVIYGPYITDNRVGCGSGTIIKTWNIWTMYGDYTCVQTINVTGGYNGYPVIQWPPDYTVTGCDASTAPESLPPPYNKPTWWAPECSQLMYTWYDEVFYTYNVQGICKKILRHWKVIDWCVYDVDHPWYGGWWACTQLIMVKDQYPPSINCPGDVVANAGPNCSGSYVHIPPAYSTDPCGNVNITNNSPYSVYHGADASGYYPPGTTKVTFCARDACGNSTYCTINVTVTDKKKPSPVVYYGLSTSLMCVNPQPMIEIQAKWFDAGSFDNCTPKSRLKFDVYPKVFTCADRGYNDVTVTVTDEAGNKETVKTFIIVDDNTGCCGPDTTNPPVLTCPGDVVIDAQSADCSGAFVDLAPATATSDCNGAVNITNNSPYATSHGANASGVYPIGTTVVTFTAVDYCNKKTTCKATIRVRDGKKPSPVVFYGLAISLAEDTINGGGTITLVPEWFDAGSFDNCTSNNNLKFDVHPKTFNCDSLGERNVRITVTDESGNSEYVDTYIVIQDPSGVCVTDFTANVAGLIKTEDGEKVSGVDMFAATQDTMYQKRVDGDYVLLGLKGGKEYEIAPKKADDYRNGVSTRDLIILKNHILGKSLMQSPYKLIAADVNNDKIINTADLILLRKLVLGTIDTLPGSFSWKFIDGNYIFDPFKPALTQNYPTYVKIQKLKDDKDGVSFIGTKMGDLNGSVLASMTSGSSVENRNNGNIKLYALASEKQRDVRVDFTPEMTVNADGIQMEMSFDPTILRFKGINPGMLTGFNSDVNMNLSGIANGIIKLSWNANNAVTVDPSAPMFSILFERLTESGEVKLKLNNTGFNAELYDQFENTFNIELINEKVESNDGFALFQNRPNPLQSFTTIGFNLPEASDIELSIFNLNGDLVRQIKGHYSKGTNNINVEWNNTRGVFYYILKAGKNAATKKMIVVE
ncbi:MAG: HYR domain-containing protein [Saprospiraceae bacterium]|nr:MAG: Hyalin repeat-containing protein [Candidatus Parvibacillus calidus]MCC7149999.1 HYR domain-containing protein [Saprospiraceae bacterium]WKZ62622.1 MAG: HYR domain-containing protein [Saprospiraceae bacterium]